VLFSACVSMCVMSWGGAQILSVRQAARGDVAALTPETNTSRQRKSGEFRILGTRFDAIFVDCMPRRGFSTKEKEKEHRVGLA